MKNKPLLLMITVCATLTLNIGQIHAESLWDDKAAAMFSDSKAFSVGDNITVVISESSTAYNKANTSLDNKSDITVGPLKSLLVNTGSPLTKLGTASTFTEADKFAGTGTTQRSGQLTAKLTAKITKITDNGEYEIEGTKDVMINSEAQKIKIKGVIRPKDIDASNTVQSSSIANAQISYSGSGPVGDSQEPGLLSKVIAFLF